ncbi:unnamed protein product [Lymnaea stagnalis]|uniref:Uncharacterized protein n=1 Tax=Lymnaea stagnalis TaxID=6523 RepID=A0AAV2HXN7_LYMST
MQVKRYDELTSLQEEMQTELANVESQGQNELANLRQKSDELKLRLFHLRNNVTKEQHHQELQDELDAQEETRYRTSRDAIRNMVYTLMQFRSYAHDRMGKANTLYRQLEELGQVIIFYQDIYRAYQETLQASQQRPKKHGVVSATSKLDASRSSNDSENSDTQNGSSLPGTARPSRVE